MASIALPRNCEGHLFLRCRSLTDERCLEVASSCEFGTSYIVVLPNDAWLKVKLLEVYCAIWKTTRRGHTDIHCVKFFFFPVDGGNSTDAF